MNRREILRRCLDSLRRHTREPFHIHVSDQGSTDGTPAMLTAYAAECPGLMSLYLLTENAGLARARNSHWANCLGNDVMRLDDKVEILTPFWSQIIRRQALNHHCITGLLDPDTEFLLYHPDAQRSDVIEFPTWKCGAACFYPAEVANQLGGWDEMNWEDGETLKYGWEDLLSMDRAEQIGWPFRYSTSVIAQFMARAGAETRARAMQFEGFYRARRAEYQEGKRDIFIDITQTEGYRLGQSVPVSSLVSVGAAMELSFP